MRNNESPVVKEIHDIRLQIHEETKNMTPAEYADFINKNAAEFAKKHGLIIVQPKRPEQEAVAYVE